MDWDTPPARRRKDNENQPDKVESFDQGKLFKTGNWFVTSMFHPAAALRAPAMMKSFKKSFKNLLKMLKKIKKVV